MAASPNPDSGDFVESIPPGTGLLDSGLVAGQSDSDKPAETSQASSSLTEVQTPLVDTLSREDQLSPYPAGSLRELLWVAVPLVLSHGMFTLALVVDRMFLYWHSPDGDGAEMAAALPAGMLQWVIMGVPIGVATYVNTFVAQYDGAGNRLGVARSLWQGVHFSLAVGLTMLALAPLSPIIFGLLDHDVAALEATYFEILCSGSGLFVLATALSSFYSGRGRTAVIMLVNAIAAFSNVVFDYLLIFGPGPFPEWGIWGAGLGTIGAYLVQAGLFVGLICCTQASRRYEVWKHWQLDWPLFGRLLYYGVPNGLYMLVEIMCFAWFVQIIGTAGTAELAATTLAFNLNALVFIPLFGLGIGVSTLVGQRIGENRAWMGIRTTWLAFRVAAVYVFFWGTIYVLLPDVILAPYAAQQSAEQFSALRQQVVILLRFVAVYSIFDAMAIVFSSAIRGAGDTRFVVGLTLTAGLLLLVLPTYINHTYLTGNLMVSFLAITAYLVVFGIGCLLRFQGGRWLTMKVTGC